MPIASTSVRIRIASFVVAILPASSAIKIEPLVKAFGEVLKSTEVGYIPGKPFCTFCAFVFVANNKPAATKNDKCFFILFVLR